MSHIICDFRPFDMNQGIMVYVNGECVKSLSVGINQVTNVVNTLKNQYNIKQIDLCGNESYLSKFKANMLNKFEDSDCEINIIQR
jgi:hypothetical protein